MKNEEFIFRGITLEDMLSEIIAKAIANDEIEDYFWCNDDCEMLRIWSCDIVGRKIHAGNGTEFPFDTPNATELFKLVSVRDVKDLKKGDKKEHICKNCDCCHLGYFKSKPNAYVCTGVAEPFIIEDINAWCTEYEH